MVRLMQVCQGEKFVMNPTTSRLATLLGTASLLTLADAVAHAQPVAPVQTAQAAPQEIPEQVLVTGSLIRGTAAVGVPVTNLSPQDFAQTGALTTADLFRTVPSANVSPGPVATQSGANIERATRVNLRGLDTGNAVRSLLLVDGVMFPPQGNGQCEIDPSIIPALAQDRVDVLVDGASATYGSNAIGGVINIILKRNYDGAVTQLRYSTAAGGKNRYMASQLWGRTWDGGDITLAYEWYDETPIMGKEKTSKWTVDFSPWGLENRTPLSSAMPGIVSTGNPATTFPGGFRANLGTACTNCFSIPAGTGSNFNPVNAGIGPTAPFSGSTLNWTTFATAGNGGTNGTRNEFNPFSIAWFDAAQQRNAATMTVDQRLTRNISFYGEGFYSNRRAQYLNPASLSPSSNDLLTVAVPTFNPYYPTGGAPNNLRVSYSTAIENPSLTSAQEVADRYLFGFNIDLPGNWSGNVYYSETYDSSFNLVHGSVNPSAVSAALGWTIPVTAPVGTTPGIGTWTKPATVPYLNLFCDAREFQCNSASTLDYVTGIRSFNEKFWSNEKGIRFDGPLFSLPGGDVKAAVGATYNTYKFSFVTFDNTSAATLIAPMLSDPRTRNVWATFAQINIPVIGEANALPGIQRFEVEASWRHDQYSDFGGTSNPKVAFNWTVSEDLGLKVRGSWGTSFRAPFFGETSALSNVNIQGWNLASFANNAPIAIACDADVGSGGYKLSHPAVGPALACNSAIGGISMNGGSNGSRGLRDLGNGVLYNGGPAVGPEKSMNWGIGGEFAPTTFLQGLDLQATWYQIKITGALSNFGNPTGTAFNAGGRGFSYIVPTDLVGVDPACTNNLTPTTCPTFQQMISSLLANPRNVVPVGERSNIFWINDGGTFNKGDIKLSGIDWVASYDWDMANLGAWNLGITGTYYLHNYITTIPGSSGDPGTPLDTFHTNLNSLNGVQQIGVESLPRMRYRARLGWSNGPWSVTGFMDYQSHYFHTQAAPPNVNFACVVAGGTLPGGSFPCAISNYSNMEPSQYTFDLSLGYDTGDTPANNYLKHIGVQLVVQNLLDRDPAFEYRISTGGGNPAAYDILKSYQGRTISLILTKTW
jgi:outer membrane receptor protein involved in Fe transport